MGACLSLHISLDQVLNRVGSYFCRRDNYIFNFKKNLVALEKAMKDLTAMRNDVKSKVQREEEGGLRRLQRVKVWLKRVETIESQFNDLNSTRTVELQRFCLGGVCLKTFRSRIRYGKRVFFMLKEADTLNSDGVFEVVAEPAARAVVEQRPIQPTIVGRDTMLEKAWNRLMDDGTEIMGFYGLSGVGKSTFLVLINNKFSGANDGVEIVISVLVSSNLRVEKIQDEIAETLGLCVKEWKQKTKSQKAIVLHNCLRNKRFVLLLDDIWDKVDLNEIGVPLPTRENNCKIAFTTRSHDICARMGVHDPMEIKCLEPKVAWGLFQTKVGKITLESHPDIPELARKVSEKCCGLPLALNVIGETMSCKRTVQEWQHAVDVMSSSSGLEDEILPVLKYAYDNLSGEKVKSCFLYCSLFPEDYLISKESLIEYWICEGFIKDENKCREKEFNQGYEIIGTLVGACLLLEGGSNKSKVKMHDVVREMALWISSDLGGNREKCVVRAGVGLCEVPKVKNWSGVERMSLMRNEMEKISAGSPNCNGLTTLLLQGNKKLVNISGEFFRFMPKLLVLDLSSNKGLTGLPEQIFKLVSLQYLDLSDTNIVRLPGGLRNLRKLMHLNLESTRRLESVSGISTLMWSLRTLKLRESKMLIDVSLVKELGRLDHLQVVTIDISSRMVAEKLLCAAQRLVECIKEVDIKYLEEESAKSLTLPTMVILERLNIEGGMMDIKIEETTSSFWNKSPTTSYLPNLSSVFIRHCNELKDLTWLLFAPNLTFLEVGFSRQMEDIISEEKALSCEAGNIVPFSKLTSLTLYDLPMLRSIYSSPLPLPCLRKISVSGCPKLRKLPLDTNSVVRVEELVIHWIPLSLYSPLVCEIHIQGNCLRLISLPLDSSSGAAREETVINYKDKEWMEGIEWEDDATRLRFLPSCKLGV